MTKNFNMTKQPAEMTLNDKAESCKYDNSFKTMIGDDSNTRAQYLQFLNTKFNESGTTIGK